MNSLIHFYNKRRQCIVIPMSDEKMQNIISLAKRRGFIFQGSEMYGGLAGTWDYGPFGVALKNNIKNLWWKRFVDGRDDMYGLDAAILMNEKVWEASGHTGAGFTDPVVDCRSCGLRHRVDHLIDGENDKFVEEVNKYMNEDTVYTQEDGSPFLKSSGVSWEKTEMVHKALSEFVGPLMQRFLNENIKCSKCGSNKWSEPHDFNLMFETKVGAQGNAKSYLRPETAQGIFVNFKNILDTMRPKLPFGIGQVGKAFRNEISPRDFIFRTREFEQMEIEYFIEEGEWEKWFEYWLDEMRQWIMSLGIDNSKVHELEVPEEDRAHYSKRTVDFEYDFPFGKSELYGLAYRTDFDLKSHMDASGEKLHYTPAEGQPFVPHVIEPTFGLDRTVLAVLDAAYTEDEMGGEKRVFLKFTPELAPVRAAVFPLLKNKPELVEKAREVYDMLKKDIPQIMWDDNGNVGKRYRRQDEIGTPHCVTIDFDTLEDDTVTVRDRDSGEQKRVTISELVQTLGKE